MRRRSQPTAIALFIAAALVALRQLAPGLDLDARLRDLGSALAFPLRAIAPGAEIERAEDERELAALLGRAYELRGALWLRERKESTPQRELELDGARRPEDEPPREVRWGFSVFADVSLKDPKQALWRIAAGARQGVAKGDYAVFREQLVGRVEEVFAEHAFVRLVTAKGQRFPVTFRTADGGVGYAIIASGNYAISEEERACFRLLHPTSEPDFERGGDPELISRKDMREYTEVLLSLGPPAYRELALGWSAHDAEQARELAALERACGCAVAQVLPDRGFRNLWYCRPVLDLERINGVHVLCSGEARRLAAAQGPPGLRVLSMNLSDRVDVSGRHLSLGLNAGRRQGLEPGAGIFSGGRLIGVIAGLTEWSARVQLLADPGMRLEGVLWLDDDTLLYPGVLRSRGRSGRELCLAAERALPAGRSGHLFAGAVFHRGLKGAYVGRCRIDETGRRLYLAERPQGDLGRVQVLLARGS